jgi:hypothetical protein
MSPSWPAVPSCRCAPLGQPGRRKSFWEKGFRYMADKKMDPRKMADIARTILNGLELEGHIELRLLQAVQLLVTAVQELSDSQRRLGTNRDPR